MMTRIVASSLPSSHSTSRGCSRPSSHQRLRFSSSHVALRRRGDPARPPASLDPDLRRHSGSCSFSPSSSTRATRPRRRLVASRRLELPRRRHRARVPRSTRRRRLRLRRRSPAPPPSAPPAAAALRARAASFARQRLLRRRVRAARGGPPPSAGPRGRGRSVVGACPAPPPRRRSRAASPREYRWRRTPPSTRLYCSLCCADSATTVSRTTSATCSNASMSPKMRWSLAATSAPPRSARVPGRRGGEGRAGGVVGCSARGCGVDDRRLRRVPRPEAWCASASFQLAG